MFKQMNLNKTFKFELDIVTDIHFVFAGFFVLYLIDLVVHVVEPNKCSSDQMSRYIVMSCVYTPLIEPTEH